MRLLDRLFSERGSLGDRLVELADVGGVMFVVVELHRFGVDVGLEGIIIVTERRELEDFLHPGRRGGRSWRRSLAG